MFIEKYQPYTQFIITYNGEEITGDNPVTLPNIVKGEYKVNLDAIGYNREDDRENLPFTRNGLTWWLIDSELNLLTKEINLDDEVGTKFTIDDSGTFSILSTYFEASEETHLMIICVLGKPRTLNIQEFDFDTEIYGSEVLPFASGGGGGGDTPKIPKTNITIKYDQTVEPSTINSQSINVYYSQVKTTGETPADKIVPIKKLVGQTAIAGTRVTQIEDAFAEGSLIIFANQIDTAYQSIDLDIDLSVLMTTSLNIDEYLGTVGDVVYTGKLLGFIVPKEVNNEQITITIHTKDGHRE